MPRRQAPPIGGPRAHSSAASARRTGAHGPYRASGCVPGRPALAGRSVAARGAFARRSTMPHCIRRRAGNPLPIKRAPRANSTRPHRRSRSHLAVRRARRSPAVPTDAGVQAHERKGHAADARGSPIVAPSRRLLAPCGSQLVAFRVASLRPATFHSQWLCSDARPLAAPIKLHGSHRCTTSSLHVQRFMFRLAEQSSLMDDEYSRPPGGS